MSATGAEASTTGEIFINVDFIGRVVKVIEATHNVCHTYIIQNKIEVSKTLENWRSFDWRLSLLALYDRSPTNSSLSYTSY